MLCILSATLAAQNTTIAIPTPTPAHKAAPPPKPKGGGSGGNPINIPYIPPPVGPSKLPPAGGALCLIIPGCTLPGPRLDNAFPFSNLTPGGYVILYGKNFLSPDGGAGKIQFSLGGPVVDLVDLQWSDTSVGGRVPDNWNGTSEQEVDMWVVRGDGVKSNNLSPRPKFTPIWDLHTLTLSDLDEWHCAPSDDYWCTDTFGITAHSYHASIYGHDSGTDIYKVRRLANGWLTYQFDFQVTQSHDGSVQTPSGMTEGLNSVDVQVHWDQDGGSLLNEHGASTVYEVNITIRGPKGTPWK